MLLSSHIACCVSSQKRALFTYLQAWTLWILHGVYTSRELFLYAKDQKRISWTIWRQWLHIGACLFRFLSLHIAHFNPTCICRIVGKLIWGEKPSVQLEIWPRNMWPHFILIFFHIEVRFWRRPSSLTLTCFHWENYQWSLHCFWPTNTCKS